MCNDANVYLWSAIYCGQQESRYSSRSLQSWLVHLREHKSVLKQKSHHAQCTRTDDRCSRIRVGRPWNLQDVSVSSWFSKLNVYQSAQQQACGQKTQQKSRSELERTLLSPLRSHLSRRIIEFKGRATNLAPGQSSAALLAGAARKRQQRIITGWHYTGSKTIVLRLLLILRGITGKQSESIWKCNIWVNLVSFEVPMKILLKGNKFTDLTCKWKGSIERRDKADRGQRGRERHAYEKVRRAIVQGRVDSLKV